MQATVTQEIEQMKKMVKSFVDNEVEPYAQQIEDEDNIPDHLVEQAKDLGLFGISIPEEYGEACSRFMIT
ncbi:acyl-CoA dehydrogenase family protein [Metabacillus dongyingensis]|uniref:acyl-CoA dehydrogenase family protein n=1 Tax=Metabacillus dongyingensis TaxID=2874282 RepID=UPI003B8CC555